MTWNASHLYSQATPDVISILKSHPTFLPGLFLIENLDDFEWPTKYFLPHGLPEGGLLVAREICETEPPGILDEMYWYERKGHPIISSSSLRGPSRLKVIRPRHIPMCLMGKWSPNAGDSYLPPKELLRFIKHLSSEANSVMAYYLHHDGADGAAELECAWVFDKEDCVYVDHADQCWNVRRYTAKGSRNLGDSSYRGKSVMQHVMMHFGVDMPGNYFAPQHELFYWDRYKLNI